MAEKRFDLRIYRDDYAKSPREWDNVGTMLCTHSKYNLGDEKQLSSSDILEKISEDVGISLDEWNSGDMTEEELYNKVLSYQENAFILPVSLYDHSGISMTTGVKQGWDSGQVGFIYVTKTDLDEKHGINEEYLKNNPDWTNGRTLNEVAKDILEGEVETYNTYLKGEVYGFEFTEYDVDDEEVRTEGCSGFYGHEFKFNGMLDNFPDELKKEVENHSCYDYDEDSCSEIWVETNDFEVTAEIKKAAIAKLVNESIEKIFEDNLNGDRSLLTNALKGEGFTPFNYLSNKQLKEEFEEIFGQSLEDFSKNLFQEAEEDIVSQEAASLNDDGSEILENQTNEMKI